MPSTEPHQSSPDWSDLFEHLPIGAYRSTPAGGHERVNLALARLNGYDSAAEQVALVRDIAAEWYVVPTRRDEFKALLERDGVVRGFVSEVYRHKTRERIWVSENAYLRRDGQGRVVGYEGTVEEITERVQTQLALERSEAQLRVIAQQLPGVAYLVHIDTQGQPQYQFVGDGVRELYGVEPAEVMRDGRTLQRMRHPDDDAVVVAHQRAAEQARRAELIEFRIVRRDGRVRWVQASATALHRGPDGVLHTGLILDITDAKEAAELRQARDRAEASQRGVQSLLSRISHELRTPLNAVLGFGQLLEHEPALPERPRQWASHIVTSGRHLLALVDDVLDLSGTRSGELSMQLSAVDIADAVASCWQLVQGDSAASTLTFEGPAPGAGSVRADPTRLRQVLTNLLSNAVKYNRRGGHIRVAVTAMGDCREIVVSDSGHGLSAAQCARLFLPFERVGAESGPIAGTGLGLALSRELVLAMHGDIGVASVPGEGTRFTVRLPAASDQAGLSTATARSAAHRPR